MLLAAATPLPVAAAMRPTPRLAQSTEKLVPHPQADLAFGFFTAK